MSSSTVTAPTAGVAGTGAGPSGRGGPAARLLGLVAAWSLVGLLSVLQLAGWTMLDGARPELARLLARQMAAALAWVPLTLAILALGRRLPVVGAGWKRALPIHLGAAIGASFLLNLALAPVLHPDLRGLVGLGAAALADGLRFLHVNLLVYGALLAAGEAWRRRPDRSSPPFDGQPAPPLLVARVGGRRVLLDPDEIRWIEGAGDFARVHGPEGPRLVSARMKELAEALDPDRFFRIHRSAIVALDRIREYRPLGHGDYEVRLEDGTPLKVSRGRGREFRRRLARRRPDGRG